jgi:hypothetical protein
MSRSGIWRVLGITAALFGVQIIVCTTAAAATTTLVAQNSQKCLDVRGGPGAIDDGTPIEQYSCTGSSNQSWELRDMGAQQYELVASNSYKCAEAVNGSASSTNGTAVQQAECKGASRQLWRLVYVSANVYRVVNAPNGLCLDVTGGPGATGDEALIELWNCTGSTNQSWGLTPPHVEPRPLMAKNSGKCLDVTGGPQATQDGALLEQYTCTGAANQEWTPRSVVGGIELVAKNSGKCIEAIGGGTDNGTGIQQAVCTGAQQQLWTQQVQVGGDAWEYKFVHVPSGRCLDVTGGPGAKSNGALLELWTCTGSTNQTWTLGAPGTPSAGTRDPLKWPFSQYSIWNMPIGSGAVYVPANLPAREDDPNDKDSHGNPIGPESSGLPGMDWERIVLKPTAPPTTIKYSSAGWSKEPDPDDPNKVRQVDRCNPTNDDSHPELSRLPVDVPIPANYVQPTDNGNDSATFLMPNGHTLVQTQPFARCTAGGTATSLHKTSTDEELYGEGRTGAHGGSKLSALGGSIRMGELRPGQQGMRHALKVALFKQMEYYDCSLTSECYRWPASSSDSGAVNDYGSSLSGHNRANRAMKMGALLAIPASVDINSLGLVSEPGRQLAWTLQNYGAYIVDSYAGPVFGLDAESGPDGDKGAEFFADYGFHINTYAGSGSPWTNDLQKIIPLLAVVDNNSPTSIGGGGTPRQPIAPPFQ